MFISKIKRLKDSIHAQLCYQLFITPFPFGIEKHYREFAEMAEEYFQEKRTELIRRQTPYPHVIHHFAQPPGANAKKVLITHGWMSKAAFMVKLIRDLHQQGYDVYALDFPAHGEAKGFQLEWSKAVVILKDIIDTLGPFYAVIGHSFGGSMLFHTINLSSQFSEFALQHKPEKAVMISSPVRMRIPVSMLARYFKMNANSYKELRRIFNNRSITDIDNLNFRRLAQHETIPFLCIHGAEDHYITPMESKLFCQSYPHAHLSIIPGLDHVEVLIDPRVENRVRRFLLENE